MEWRARPPRRRFPRPHGKPGRTKRFQGSCQRCAQKVGREVGKPQRFFNNQATKQPRFPNFVSLFLCCSIHFNPNSEFRARVKIPPSAKIADALFSIRAAGNEKGGDDIAAVFSNHFFGQPVADLEVFPYFSPLMAVFEGLFGMMLSLAERMLWVANCFAHCFECFHHSIFLSVH